MSVETLSLIELMMSYEPLSRPSVQMVIDTTEMIISAKAAQVPHGSLEAIQLEAELDNRYQFMLIEKYMQPMQE